MNFLYFESWMIDISFKAIQRDILILSIRTKKSLTVGQSRLE
jgi:hypothetical protein